jgi:hypothetical protein
VYSFEGNRLRVHHSCQAGKGVLETVGVGLLTQIRAEILAEDELVAVLPACDSPGDVPDIRAKAAAVINYYGECDSGAR